MTGIGRVVSSKAILQLKPGTLLGPYQIDDAIGQGGMGEVYRATDTRLDRAVAVKILPGLGTDRDDRRTRFKREAKAVSQLNHPNICTLHDVGEETVDGAAVHFLVMELLDGETLADRINRGPLPLEQVLRYAMEIAIALDAAHRSGIIHRDLKPGNVMITNAGVKLLDFGLAKTLKAPSSESAAPTLQAVTAENALVGTLQYMSPEQLSGGTVDARSDIFALGAVMYEMVTGARAFSGMTQASIVAAIIHADPRPVSELRTVTPPSLERIITMCLAKNPEERWQNARDVMLQLRTVHDEPRAPVAGSRTRWLPLAAVAVLGALAGAGGMMALRRSPPAVAGGPKHVTMEINPPLEIIPNGFGAPFDISRDGSRLVWVGVENERRPALFVRRLAALDVQRLAGSEGASSPFFSPDGESVGFYANTSLRVASLRSDGRAVRMVAPSGPGGGGTWIDDKTIVFAPLPGAGLKILDLTSGKVDDVTKVDAKRGEASHSWPHAVYGTRTFLYTIEREGQPWDEAQIGAYSLDTGAQTIVLDGGARPRYASGKLYFVRGSQLMSVDFDPKTLRTSGTPAVAVTDVVAQPGTGGSFFAVAGDGSVAYLRGKPDFFATRVITRRADGTSATLAVPLRTYANPRLSHDGSRLAVQVVSANDDVWIFHRERGTFTRVTAQAENLFPQWSPDDKTFLVTMFLNSAMPVLATVPITGTLKPQALAPDGPPVQIGTSWSASGRIAYTGMGGPERTADVFVIDRPGAASRPIIQTRFEEHESSLSPDGRWIVYTSDESGTAEIYLRAVDAPAEKLQLSISGGSEPLWSRDGKRIFFRSGTAFHAVDVTMGTVAPSAGAPHRLFEGDYLYGSEAQGYDVGPDGTFVLLQRNGSAQDGGRLHILFK